MSVREKQVVLKHLLTSCTLLSAPSVSTHERLQFPAAVTTGNRGLTQRDSGLSCIKTCLSHVNRFVCLVNPCCGAKCLCEANVLRKKVAEFSVLDEQIESRVLDEQADIGHVE